MLTPRTCNVCCEDILDVECDDCLHRKEMHGSVNEVVTLLLKNGWRTFRRPDRPASAPLGHACPACAKEK